MQRPKSDEERGWKFELYEERLAFSVQPLADFWYDADPASTIEPSAAQVSPRQARSQPSPALVPARGRYSQPTWPSNPISSISANR